MYRQKQYSWEVPLTHDKSSFGKSSSWNGWSAGNRLCRAKIRTIKEVAVARLRQLPCLRGSSEASRMTSDEIQRLQDQIGQLTVRLERAEHDLAEAKAEAHEARE